MFVCALCLYPATPGLGVRCGCVCLGSRCGYAPLFPAGAFGGCVCVCACSACTPPLLAGMCGVGVCAAARVPAARRQSWPGGWAVCVFMCMLCLYPAIPGRVMCVCGFGFRSHSAFLLVWVLGRVASCVRRTCFPPPSGGAVRGVGVCGSCCGWGLSPTLPLFFLPGCGDVSGLPPCRVVALWCPPLPVPV